MWCTKQRRFTSVSSATLLLFSFSTTLRSSRGFVSIFHLAAATKQSVTHFKDSRVQQQQLQGKKFERSPNSAKNRHFSDYSSEPGECNWKPRTSNSTPMSDGSKTWTVCPTCRGEGRISQRLSKKSRYRLQQQHHHHQQNISNDINASSIEPNTTLVRPTQVCRSCQGSGLQEALSDEKLPRAVSTSPSKSSVVAPHRFHVAVVGGGLAGLAFVAACRHRGLSVTCYERDAHFDERKQGYGLTLQQAASQLRALGIRRGEEEKDIRSSSIRGGITSTRHVVHNAHGEVMGTWGMRHWMGDTTTKQSTDGDEMHGQSRKKARHSKRQNVHIARQALRYELFRAATEDRKSDSVVQWNHKLVNFKQKISDNERVGHNPALDLEFEVSHGKNGAPRKVHVCADLLVGADGIRSKVRELVLPKDTLPLRYLGCAVVLGICTVSKKDIDLVDKKFSHLLDGETVFQTADGTTRIYMMPYSQTEYMWQLSFPIDEVDATTLSKQGPQALKEEALRRCGEWHSPVPDILIRTPPALVSGYPVYDRALLHPEHLSTDCTISRRVTLLGDAAHPMSPFKGQGANQALLDALSLARSIYKSSQRSKLDGKDLLYESILQYEAEMIERSKTKVLASAEAARFLHTEVAIQQGNVTRGAAAANPLHAR